MAVSLAKLGDVQQGYRDVQQQLVKVARAYPRDVKWVCDEHHKALCGLLRVRPNIEWDEEEEGGEEEEGDEPNSG